MQRLAFFSHTQARQTLARQHGRDISVAQFCADVDRLAGLLPTATHLVNGCQDRYHFTVSFAAALLRSQISVLPHNHLPDTMEQLGRDYPGLYCVTDSAFAPIALPMLKYPEARQQDAGAVAIDRLAFAADQVAAILFTSGSTGAPQAHPRTWGSIVASGRVEAERLFRAGPPTSGPSCADAWSIVATVPGQHSYGFESTVHLALQSGGILVAERPFFPADVLQSLATSASPRLLVTTPVHLRALMMESALDSAGCCELILSATAPLPDELATQVEQRIGAPVHEIYGSTESGQVATRRTLDGDQWTCFEAVEIHPDQHDSERAWVSGGHVETPIMMADRIAVLDRTRFVLHGRTNDVVNIAGKRGSLQALNSILLGIPGVLDGAFGLLGDERQIDRRLCAFVVAPGLDAATIRNALREKIEAVFLPRPLHLVASLPRDANGKLPQQRLVELAALAASANSGEQ